MRGEVAAADDDELLSNKLKQLREIRLAGLEVIHVIHRHGIADEKTAYEVEAALIDAYPGLTNIMNGAGSNEYGAAHIKELIATYQPETVEFKHKALMISVNRSSKDVDLYDAVRFSWRVSLERASKAEVIIESISYRIHCKFSGETFSPDICRKTISKIVNSYIVVAANT